MSSCQVGIVRRARAAAAAGKRRACRRPTGGENWVEYNISDNKILCCSVEASRSAPGGGEEGAGSYRLTFDGRPDRWYSNENLREPLPKGDIGVPARGRASGWPVGRHGPPSRSCRPAGNACQFACGVAGKRSGQRALSVPEAHFGAADGCRLRAPWLRVLTDAPRQVECRIRNSSVTLRAVAVAPREAP